MMKVSGILLTIFAVCGTLFGADRTGVVTAGNLNVRIQNNDQAQVVAKLVRGDKVTVVEENGKWLKIVAPKNVPVYVSSALVKNGKTVKSCNLRCGAGIQYQSYGIIPAGTAVKVTGTAGKEWVKVEPFDTLCCFVAKEFVKTSEPSAGAVPPAAPPKTPAPAAAPGVPAASPAQPDAEEAKALENLRAYYDKNNARAEALTGVIMAVSGTSKAVHYALVEEKDGQFVVLCYLVGAGAAKAGNYVNVRVKVSGTSYPVKKWSKPVLEVTEIQAAK